MTRYEREKIAISHIDDMEDIFGNEISNSVKKSIVYNESTKLNYPPKNSDAKNTPDIIIMAKTTEKAIIQYQNYKTAALNFASYKYPGGGFVKGSIAQEEALCHTSTLYNVISDSKFNKEYKFNRENTNNGLYRNWGIYSPDIIFPIDDYTETNCDILTCPAPNLSAYKGDKNTYKEYLEKRIKFTLDIFYNNSPEIIILGAFGCGVFGNEPGIVAKLFKKYLTEYNYGFKKVIFAIPEGPNLQAFQRNL